MLGKQARKSVRKEGARPRDSCRLQLIHSDLCREICPTFLGGNQYFVTFTDDYSRFTWIYFMHSKSDILKHFLAFKAIAKLALRTKVEQLRTDNGREYISTAFQHALVQARIHHEFTQVYTSRQNGVSEHKNRTLLEKAHAMVYEACTP